MNPKRPFEITTAGALAFGMGLFFFLHFLTNYFLLKHIFLLQPYSAPFPYVRIAISLIMTAGFFIFGVFILCLKNWARIFALVWMLCWVGMGLALVREAYGIGSVSEAWRGYITFYLIPSIVIIYLLTRPTIIEEFNRNARYVAVWRIKILAVMLGGLLLTVYLSAPYGVWDGSAPIGGMISKIRSFIFRKPAEVRKSEKPSLLEMNEQAVMIQPSLAETKEREFFYQKQAVEAILKKLNISISNIMVLREEMGTSLSSGTAGYSVRIIAEDGFLYWISRKGEPLNKFLIEKNDFNDFRNFFSSVDFESKPRGETCDEGRITYYFFTPQGIYDAVSCGFGTKV